ncbi:hypothetical protein OUZ56_007454 [Daphnia magna]|uniref:Meiotic nuclear division protein 1 homolog n=1 Tax=Daphnia magna TaxID=35525 RepID=A0ABR0AA07_9CRUS|nr:hypothetical protein OUZ56_007454 [Daphnia magna]
MTSKKRGLSLEDKRKGMMEIFYEKKDFFQLKELEKIAPKEKGIVQGTVKDVLQSLVDDGMVDTDKIGTSVYFWAFPSKATNTKKQKLMQLENSTQEAKKLRADVEAKLAKKKTGQQDEEKREKLQVELKKAQEKNTALKSSLKEFHELDPDELEKLKSESQVSLEAANRWTDNIFAVKSWCKSKFFIEENQLNKAFGIPDELDYL